MTDDADVRARVLLAGVMYRATMRAYAGALASAGLSGPTPEEKMRLHQEVETRAWALPPDAAASVAGRDVDEGIEGAPLVEEEVARIVADAMGRRRGA